MINFNVKSLKDGIHRFVKEITQSFSEYTQSFTEVKKMVRALRPKTVTCLEADRPACFPAGQLIRLCLRKIIKSSYAENI